MLTVREFGMEKRGYSSDGPSGGNLQLPVGFRFRPSDEELVVHYLQKKIQNLPLPAYVIPVFDVFQSEPWNFPGDRKEVRYFFCNREWSWQKCKGIVDSGYWKCIGSEKKIVSSSRIELVGLRKSLVFYAGKPGYGTPTNWVMLECQLPSSFSGMEEWMVYKVYRKRRSRKYNPEISVCFTCGEELIEPVTLGFSMEDGSGTPPPQPFSSSDECEGCDFGQNPSIA